METWAEKTSRIYKLTQREKRRERESVEEENENADRIFTRNQIKNSSHFESHLVFNIKIYHCIFYFFEVRDPLCLSLNEKSSSTTCC